MNTKIIITKPLAKERFTPEDFELVLNVAKSIKANELSKIKNNEKDIDALRTIAKYLGIGTGAFGTARAIQIASPIIDSAVKGSFATLKALGAYEGLSIVGLGVPNWFTLFILIGFFAPPIIERTIRLITERKNKKNNLNF